MYSGLLTVQPFDHVMKSISLSDIYFSNIFIKCYHTPIQSLLGYTKQVKIFWFS